MLVVAIAASLLAAGPILEAPWSCEQTYSVTQGNGGATSHTGVAQYAWDFGLPVGTDVRAAAGGTVARIKMNSFTGGCNQAFANDANYVVIDHGDGTGALYLHLEGNSSNLQVGDPVATGDVIGRVGLTGWTCGAHLHFQVQQLCASWWCQSLASEFYGEGAIAYGETMKSENCGECNATLSGGQTTISESQVQCFDRLTKYWWDAGEGLDGHHWFTYATAAGQAETIGRWRFAVTAPGDYLVEVHVPGQNANSTGAKYHVHHAGVVDQVGVNQGAQKGWQALGTFYFDGGGDEYLELPDNTGEPEGDLVPLAFDSVRFTFMDAGDGDGDPTGDGDGDPTTGDGDGDPTTGDGDPSTGDGDGDPTGGCDVGQPGCMCTTGGGCDPGAVCIDGWCTPEPSGDDDGGESGTDDGGGGVPDGYGIDRGEDGCACSTAPGRDAGGPALVMLGLLFAATRRRRSLD